MNSECIFCKIISKEIASNIVYEDNQVIAILDINPINLGHTLIIPKVHIPEFYNMGDAIYTHSQIVAKSIAVKINARLKPVRVGMVIAGWDVPHTHIHIVPMNDHRDLTSIKLLENKLLKPSQEEFDAVKELLS